MALPFFTVLIMISVGLVKPAPVTTPTTNITSLASKVTDATPSTCTSAAPNVLDFLHLDDLWTWMQLSTVWLGFLICFILCCVIYYLLTHSRGLTKIWRERTRRHSTGGKTEQQTRKYPRRIFLFEWGLTRKDYESYFWDPEGYGRRRYEEQEAHTLHRLLSRWLRISRSHKKVPSELDAAERGEASMGVHPVTSSRDFSQPRSHSTALDSEALTNTTRLRKRFRSGNTSYNDAPERLEQGRSYARQFYQSLDGAESKRASSDPTPVTQGWRLPRSRFTESVNSTSIVDMNDAQDLDHYEAEDPIDVEVSSRASSSQSSILRPIRAEQTQASSIDRPNQALATDTARRISQIPQLSSSAALCIPKTRPTLVKSSKTHTEPDSPYPHSCLEEMCPSESKDPACFKHRILASVCHLSLRELSELASMDPRPPLIEIGAFRELEFLRRGEIENMRAYKQLAAMSPKEQLQVYEAFKKTVEGQSDVSFEARDMQKKADLILKKVGITAQRPS